MLLANSSVRLFNWFNIRKVILVTFATKKAQLQTTMKHFNTMVSGVEQDFISFCLQGLGRSSYNNYKATQRSCWNPMNLIITRLEGMIVLVCSVLKFPSKNIEETWVYSVILKFISTFCVSVLKWRCHPKVV